MQVEITSFNCATSTGLQTITASGLGSVVPKAVLFIGVGSDIFDDNDTHAKLVFGAADGTRQWAQGGNAGDGQSTTQTATISRTDKCIAFTSDAGSSPSLDGEAGFDAFVAGGVRINWTNSLSDDYKCIAVFFAGTDVSVRADTFTLGSQDSEVDVTAPGFRPKCIIAALPGWGASSLNNTYRVSIGAAVDNGSGYDQRCWIYQDYDNVGTSRVRGQIRTNRVGGLGDDTYDVELTTPDASGFSCYSRRGSPTSDAFHYLALTFDNSVKLFSHSAPGSTGNNAVTGIGFEPNTVLLATTSQTSLDTDQEQDMSHGFSAFKSGSEQWSQSINSEDSSGTSDCNSIPYELAHGLFDVNGTSDSIRASYVSMDTDGFTLNYSLAAITGAKAWGLAFGPVPTVTGYFMMVA